jgi:hypothetical protein
LNWIFLIQLKKYGMQIGVKGIENLLTQVLGKNFEETQIWKRQCMDQFIFLGISYINYNPKDIFQ